MTTNNWSVPETDLLERIGTTLDEDEGAVLATVVAVDGSAYRRPGAKMLIDPERGGAGSITAGCLEDEVRSLALDVLDEGAPRVETWDLTGDDDVWGMGVGCNGVITVLLEPLDTSFRPVVTAYEDNEAVGVATVVAGDLSTGARAVYHPGEGFDAAGTLPTWLTDQLEEPLERLVADGKGETITIETDGNRVEVFLDGIRPAPELVVFGSGHDVGPVVELANLVDFRVTVVTFRGAQDTTERFPGADTVMSATPRDVADLREWDKDTYAVVMSHNFVDDRFALAELLTTSVPYIGLMGPRKRFTEMREDFEDEGDPLPASELERVYTPIGLRLGGDTPYQIAYSIVAELLAVAHDKQPQHLKHHEGPIHDRVDTNVQ